MAFTGFLSRYLHYQRIFKELLAKRNPLILRNRDKSSLTPWCPFTGKPGLFSIAKIKEYPETIPLVVICGLGAFAEVVILLRNWLTRDDIRYWSSMAYERDANDIRAGKPPNVRKFFVMKQKYAWPEGLVKAYRDMDEANEKGKSDDKGNANDKDDCKKKK